ncbi:MAG TPA: DNA-3-methyladenine glycosylase [Vicinamibacterales bacterium]|nr:DNA-3-methyladenine glycosylase [Vicinamibacterales bacterium]
MKPDYSAARRHLMKADPKLRDIIKRVGPCELHSAAPKDPFVTLCTSIASQQLSIKAAATIFSRFQDLFPPDRTPTPERVMTLADNEIRACGFSGPKAGFIKDLAGRVLDGRLDLKGLKKHSDEEVMEQLVAVKGIGRWTAEIFLMFRLGRPDILPADDIGLMNAVHRAYKLRKRPDAKKLRQMGEAWRPYRSIAAWYLWQSLTK